MTRQIRALCVPLLAALMLPACQGGKSLGPSEASTRDEIGQGESGLVAPGLPAENGVLRVMSWNVRYASTRDTYEDWPIRAPDLATLLAVSEIDVLGVQEMVSLKDGHRQLEDIQAMLPGFNYIGRSRSATNPDDEQSGVFYRVAALEAVRSGFFWLSPAPQTPGSFGYGNQGNPRMATWAQFRNRTDNTEFTLVNTHFDNRSSEARYRSADQIEGYLNADLAYAEDGVEIDPNLPMILIGDFNFTLRQDENWVPETYRGRTIDPLKTARNPALFGLVPPVISQADPGVFPMAGNLSPYNRLVTNGSFLDALAVAETRFPEPIGTYSAFGSTDIREGIIDWILVTPDVRVLQSYIETYRPDGSNFPSDHLPVVTDVLIPR